MNSDGHPLPSFLPSVRGISHAWTSPEVTRRGNSHAHDANKNDLTWARRRGRGLRRTAEPEQDGRVQVSSPDQMLDAVSCGLVVPMRACVAAPRLGSCCGEWIVVEAWWRWGIRIQVRRRPRTRISVSVCVCACGVLV